MQKPAIALTMGDPAGVGPELVLRALGDRIVGEDCRLFVFGDARILERVAAELKLPMPTVCEVSLADFRAMRGDDFQELDSDVCTALPSVVHVDSLPDSDALIPCQVSAAAGRASFDFIQAAIDAAQAGQVDAVTTGPINKEALRAAGIHFPGHTEMFAERAQSSRWCMMQYSETITCTFVTVHVGYAEVPKLLTTERVLDTIELTADALRTIRGKRPHLVVCGLNPHAGERGLFGDREEERIIIPAIEAARSRGISIEGPLPPDTAFLPAKRAEADAIVCMYHDQGHIPVKALAFDSAVNTTLGLNMTRTSVDHGTAFDIAWQGVAKPNSLFAALRLAGQLARSSHSGAN